MGNCHHFKILQSGLQDTCLHVDLVTHGGENLSSTALTVPFDCAQSGRYVCDRCVNPRRKHYVSAPDASSLRGSRRCILGGMHRGRATLGAPADCQYPPACNAGRLKLRRALPGSLTGARATSSSPRSHQFCLLSADPSLGSDALHQQLSGIHRAGGGNRAVGLTRGGQPV